MMRTRETGGRGLALLGAFALALVLCLSSRTAMASEFVAIVNAKNPVVKLTASDLRDLYLVEQKTWSGDMRVTIILPTSNSPAMDALLEVLRMSNEQALSMHYMAAVFRQTMSTPPRTGDVDASLAAVKSDPGAIAIVPRSAALGHGAVRIIEVDGL